MDISVSIRNLSVTLGTNTKALDDISLDLGSGRAIGFIGPSGAGKTTLIRSIVGGISPSSGSVRVLGEVAGSAKLRKDVSYMTQELSVYPDLTVVENIKYFATMYGQSRSEIKNTVKVILKEIDLEDRAKSLVKNLSGGQKQRASLAIALIGSPKLMVLDEPTIGLDPLLRDSLWKLFNKLTAAGTTILVSSHSMDEAQRCDDLVLIRDGKIIAHDTPANLAKQTKTKTIEESFLKLVRGES